MASVLTSVAQPAGALGEEITVTLGQVDGTPDPPANTWSTDDNPGNDSGPNNGIVRTNDILRYDVEIRVEAASATNVTVAIPLPIGVEAKALPPFCLAGSSISPALPPPVVPITAASWAALPQQTLTCVLGNRSPGSTFTYPFATTVRSEVPQGTTLGPVSAQVTSDDVPDPVVSNPVEAIVSARPKYDLSKNAISFNENGGYLGGGSRGPCPSDPAKTCFNYLASVLIAAQDGGKGSAPLASPIVITDDLSPDSLYGQPNGYPVTTDPDWVAAGANALQMYGAELRSCPNTSVYTAPAIRIGGTYTETNAVRDSGTITCAQPGGPGTPVTITITDADTSAYTVPTESYYPNGNALPGGQGYVVAARIDFGIPIDAVRDLGVDNGGGNFRLRWDNIYTDFDASDVTGTPNDVTADPALNSHRAVTSQITSRGSWRKAFIGVPNAVGNTPPVQFRPGWAVWEGPTNTTSYLSGDGVMLPTQQTISGIEMHNTSTSGEPVSFLICDNWDNTKLRLSPDNYTGSFARMQQIPSQGEAVWFSGYYHQQAYSNSGVGLPALNIEYGTGPAGNTETCDDGDSPDGWETDPTLLPLGIASVSKVRIAATIPASSVGGGTYTTVSIALETLPNAIGTILPNWASGKRIFGTHTLAEMVADPTPWRTGTYNPTTHSGTQGDRLTVGAAVSRLDKDVWDNNAAAWVSTTPTITGNTDVDYRLSPTLTAGIATGVTVPVSLEDCLPLNQTFVNGSASVPPTLIQFGSPAGANLSCPAGQIYLRWDLGPQTVGATITPLVFTAHVSAASPNGTYTNNAMVTSEGDPSDPSLRTSSAQVEIIQPAGVAIEKLALTPQLDLNRVGETFPDLLLWDLSFRNLDLPGVIADVDVIDVLPSNGLNGTSFNGTLTFDHATVTSGSGIQILYSSEPHANVDLDGNHPSNDAVTGTTVWCDAPIGGLVMAGAGVAADCPASLADVTALRIQHPGVFPRNAQFNVEVGLLPMANLEGDVYVNGTGGRALGLDLPVGPVFAPELIIASSLGDRVWNDLNGNGIQDPAEQGLDGVTVSLWGTDSDGNAVASATAPLTTTTAGGGYYVFDQLPAGTYNVLFDDSLLASDEVWTGSDVGVDELVDSDGDRATGLASGAVLASNTDDVSVDQGYLRRPTLSGYVYADNNNDGDRAGETGLAGVTVNLTGTDNLGNAVTLTTTTGADGSYSFPELWPGSYTVAENQTTVPAPFLDGLDTAGSIGGNTTTNDVISAIRLNGTDSAENNFGELSPATISGVVFGDDDLDGSFTVGETPIADVTVVLTGTDDLGNMVSLTTTTAADGSYSFPDLRPGTYTVTETQPLLWLDGGDEAGTNGGISNDDETTEIVVAPGDDATGYNFGEEALAPGLMLVKTVNADDADVAPGIYVDTAAPVIFEYTVTNAGNLDLIDVELTDDIIGPIACPQTDLVVGASMVCTANGVAVEGAYTNIGTASAQPLDPEGLPYGPSIESNDPANYYGGITTIELIKLVDGDDANTAPGPAIDAGTAVVFTYEVTNTGNIDLTDLSVTDDIIGAIDCPVDRLAPGQTTTCTATDSAAIGDYRNVGTATAQPVFAGPSGDDQPIGAPLSAADPAHYFGEHPEITIVKRVAGHDANISPGAVVQIGQDLLFTYEITNTGNVPLGEIGLDDDVLGAVQCPQTILAVGDSMTCEMSDVATVGEITNIGTVSSRQIDEAGVSSGPAITDSDIAIYSAREEVSGLGTRGTTPAILAFTGSTTGSLLLLGASLMGVGWLLYGGSRRRKVSENS